MSTHSHFKISLQTDHFNQKRVVKFKSVAAFINWFQTVACFKCCSIYNIIQTPGLQKYQLVSGVTYVFEMYRTCEGYIVVAEIIIFIEYFLVLTFSAAVLVYRVISVLNVWTDTRISQVQAALHVTVIGMAAWVKCVINILTSVLVRLVHLPRFLSYYHYNRSLTVIVSHVRDGILLSAAWPRKIQLFLIRLTGDKRQWYRVTKCEPCTELTKCASNQRWTQVWPVLGFEEVDQIH